eukprot:161861-Prymnesium_polylepis.2
MEAAAAAWEGLKEVVAAAGRRDQAAAQVEESLAAMVAAAQAATAAAREAAGSGWRQACTCQSAAGSLGPYPFP